MSARYPTVLMNQLLDTSGVVVGKFSSHAAAYTASRMLDNPEWDPLSPNPMTAYDLVELERIRKLP